MCCCQQVETTVHFLFVSILTSFARKEHIGLTKKTVILRSGHLELAETKQISLRPGVSRSVCQSLLLSLMSNVAAAFLVTAATGGKSLFGESNQSRLVFIAVVVDVSTVYTFSQSNKTSLHWHRLYL